MRFVAGIQMALGVVPMKPKVVTPAEVTAVVFSLEASYWTLNCGADTEVIVSAPELVIPPAYTLPELSTRKRAVSPAAL